jgi:hypothetical protein
MLPWQAEAIAVASTDPTAALQHKCTLDSVTAVALGFAEGILVLPFEARTATAHRRTRRVAPNWALRTR